MDVSRHNEIAGAVGAYGYAVVIAEGYAYTVGDTTYVVAGLDDDAMAQVLNRVFRGQQVFEGYDVKVVPADPETLDLEFARSGTPVFQVLWPDVHGVYPDEDAYQGREQVLFQ